MTKPTLVWITAASIAFGAMPYVHAEPDNLPVDRPALATPLSAVPRSGFFFGLGGNLNAVRFGTQDVYAIGTSKVFQNGVLTQYGSAQGPASISMDDEIGLGFSVQGGYFQHFPDSPWLWGAKFAYSYLGTTSEVRNALLPQTGSFTIVGGGVVPFTGTAVVRSFETRITHQLSFIPIVGRSFERSFVYVGAGPTLSQVQLDLNGLIGFADINGHPTDVSGAPLDLSSSGWVFGGAATIGATYFFDSSWFLDASYTFAITANHTSNFSSPFVNPNGTQGPTVVGTMVGTSTGQVITQALTVTINRVF